MSDGGVKGPLLWLQRATIPILVSGACVILGAAVASTVYEPVMLDPHASEMMGSLVTLDALVGLIAAVAVGPLRRSLIGNLVLVALMPWVQMAGPAGFVALYRLGTTRRWGLEIGASLYVVVAMTVYALLLAEPLGLDSTHWALALPAGLAIVLPATLFGHLRGTRTALVDSLRERAAAAEHERIAVIREHEARLTQVRATERTAIAREMHDSLSHHLSILAVTAGALESRADLSPEQTRSAAGVIRNAAGVANAELRDVLLALRTSEPDDGPVSSAIAIEALLQRTRALGKEVTLTWHGVDADALDAGQRTAAFAVRRIAGEMLTNIGKYASGPASLDISHADGTLRIRSANAHSGVRAAERGTGMGLVGLTERARLLGGDATSRMRDGLFEVEAWFPWER